MKYFRSHILFGVDESSILAGAKDVEAALKAELAKLELTNEVSVLETGSLGFFERGVCFTVYPDNITYGNVKVENIPELVKEHFLKGRPFKKLIIDTVGKKIKVNPQQRIVLKNSGTINPEKIDEYLGVGGYEALEKALLKMKPEAIVDEVKKSGLRGRGGAGFSTGLKWSFTSPLAKPKYVVINADEGEPGTFKDRLIMEGDPHLLLEGIMIMSYAIGAEKAFIYIRGEYRLCIERLKKAIADAYEYGLLGVNIFDTGFNLDIEIKVGAGAYVCGEETALIESIEGKRGQPRIKPPFPGQKGVWQIPTVVNNVETIANIPSIISNGADWFNGFGTKESKGTKVYTILGDVENPGLCEVDMGMTLRDIIKDFGGGMKEGKNFKAALVGGAAGVIIGTDMLDVPMSYEHLGEYKAVLGSGAILVMSEGVDIVAMLKNILKFFRHESCGKCAPCREGTRYLYRICNMFCNNVGSEKELNNMLNVSLQMNKTCLCALGQSPYMPIQSALKYFRGEFINKYVED